MKKYLQALLLKAEKRQADLKAKSDASTDVAEVRAIGADLDIVASDIMELRAKIAELPDDDDGALEQRGAGTPPTKLNVLGTYGVEGGEQRAAAVADPHDTVEYRQAFMSYVQTGVKPEGMEFRTDYTTGTGDIGAVIPTTILNKIVEKLKDYGMIWSRVTKTGVKGGVQIPVATVKPTATWVSAGSMAAKQKKATSGTITFSYYKLQCRVAVELVADTVAMPVFETTITDNIYEAMIVAIETAIISGDGTGEPLGIVNDTDIPTAQVVEVAAADLSQYDKWTALLAKLPRSYRNGAVLILNDMDWNKYIVGMVDANGQPVARTTYGVNGIQEDRFLGKEVIAVEGYLPSIDDASSGDVFGIVVKLSDYMFNANMQLTYKRYFNEDTDEWISKSTLIADGKLADKNGVLLLKKK